MNVRVGRPRSAEADAAILDAAIRAIEEQGLDFSVERVAHDAGVGKATVYRRYPTREDLLRAALGKCVHVGAAMQSAGSLDGDLRAIVDGMVTFLTETETGRLLPRLLADMHHHPDLEAVQSAIVAERRAPGLALLRGAVARGEIAAGTDLELVLDQLSGPVFYRLLIRRAPLDESFRAELVARVARGLRR